MAIGAALLSSVIPLAGASAVPAVPAGVSSVRLAVIMFTLPSAATFSVTPDAVRATYFGGDRSVATFYAAASRGRLQITGDVYGPYAIAGDTSACDLATWSESARSATAEHGVDLGQYSNFAYLFPRVDACPWAGLAAIGDRNSYINAPAAGDVGLYHAAHELGHDLGANHAHSLTCAVDGTPVSVAAPDTCVSDEYGDPFSVMGSGIVRLPSAWERMEMGFLSASEVGVTDASAGASFEVSDLDGSDAGVRLMLLRRSDGSYLTLEYRRAGSTFDTFAGTGAAAGVFVHYVASDDASDADLIDATPSTATFRDAFIAIGGHLDDEADGISISVNGATTSAASISVGPFVGGQQSNAAPAPTATPAADQTAPGPIDSVWVASHRRRKATIAWTAGVDDVRVVRYRVTVVGRGTNRTKLLRTTFRRLTSGRHTVLVSAIDAAGNVGPATSLTFTL